MSPQAHPSRRTPLTRERVLEAAVVLADQTGIASVTMRKLGEQLDVEAMSLYNHVTNKDDVLDGIVDLIVSDIEVPPAGTEWKQAMRHRALSAHEVLLAHPWAALLLMSRFNIGPGMTRYLDSTLGCLREGGFTIDGALDAWNTIDSHIYGFTLQELNLPFEVEQTQQVSKEVLESLPVLDYPYVAEVVGQIARTGREENIEFGLNLILDGLERNLEH
jgi:AcrR family transcriptional regulator